MHHTKRKWIGSSMITLLLLALLWAVNSALAQGPVSSQISYQGFLNESGQPVTGSRDMTFRLYTDDVCTSQVGSDIVQNGVAVTNGFFSVELDVSQPDFNGQGIWIAVDVGGTILDCQKVLPTPYALSLRPGAVIEGNSFVGGLGSSLLSLKDNGFGRALYVQTENVNAGYFRNENGTSLHALTTGGNSDSAAVWGQNSASGYGGYFYSQNGTGLHGASTSGVGIYGVSSAAAKAGIQGEHTGIGNAGKFESDSGTGVYALTNGFTDNVAAVWGQNSANGYGGYFFGEDLAGLHGGSTNGHGVFGVSSASASAGVYASNTSAGGPDLALDGNDGIIDSDPSSNSSEIILRSKDDVRILLDSDNNNGFNRFRLTANTTSFLTNNLFEVDEDGNVYADGTYNCGMGEGTGIVNVNLGGGATGLNENSVSGCLADNSPADFAEMLPMTEPETLEPGDVLVVNLEGELARSDDAYQPTVVGVYSTRPSYLGNAQFADEDGYAPLALVGIVPVKASAENGSIQPGDLLVASETAGHAMHGSDDPPQGTVIGKALQGLDTGTGVIQMLVMLQ